ncbi:TIM barrel protein [Paenibacillus radicis (ex Gao et al. 2016)]|uniref:Xylose isomerase n=1 Tax=Paenibacillus radicis (ex Gao et al. 2016) TaxID=1737354 RepID=A0A917H5K9_9BACL|nr:TIM barrel protein [Paenibacillus radicis (ex Gao et al. 2016)]GGG68421.1 xylose isomerase [Paenibacillus radicis (ex Gao et al. 2016)]
MSLFKFSVGPWNVHEGADAFGPDVRPSLSFDTKLKKFKEMGFEGIQFHDDDAVPDMNDLSEKQIISRAAEVKAFLDEQGLEAEFVAPRLWIDPRTVDGGFTSNSQSDREFALWRAFRSIDIAKELGTNRIVLWLAREGTLCLESKDPVESMVRLREAVNAMLAYDPNVRILIEPKPNEPIDRSFLPTVGHVLGFAAGTNDSSRVGALLESAHAVLAGLEPAIEMGFGLAHGKLWGVHLNDQNGLRYDQDKAFGVENLRSAFNQVKVLTDHQYGKNGEFVGLDVKAMRTQSVDQSFRHLENSLRMTKLLENKVRRLNREKVDQFRAARDYEALEMYIMELLLGEESA